MKPYDTKHQEKSILYRIKLSTGARLALLHQDPLLYAERSRTTVALMF